MPGKPDAERDITEDLVRHLLTTQHPDLAALPLRHVGSGWDNEVYRLGDSLALRLPRREVAEALIINEQRWLTDLAQRLPVSVPAPCRTGRPDDHYPWRWSVTPWFEGEEADIAPPDASTVDVLAAFLSALHVPAPESAPHNPLRGVPLNERAAAASERMARLRSHTDVMSPQLMALWEQGVSMPFSSQRRWLHGDLHAQNVLTRKGKLAAVIDWGDMTGGDPATDLTCVWSLYERRADRERLLSLYDPDEATLTRARAWAVWFIVILIDTGRHNSPRHERQGRAMLSRLLADA